MIAFRLSAPALACAILVCAASTPAASQMVCGDRASIISQLEGRYGESRRSIGLQEGRGIVEVWASDETGTWSIVITNPMGLTCLLAAGDSFQADQIVPSSSDTPA